MVRGLGVSHKSLFVPSVTEGSYAIRFEHADYLAKDFNISVGSGLPTTFTEGMTEKSYLMSITPHYGVGHILSEYAVTEGATVSAAFMIVNIGNVPDSADWSVGISGQPALDSGSVGPLAPGTASDIISVDINTATLGAGSFSVEAKVYASHTGALTDTVSETLYVAEWTTDITFIATAPGIPDLHGVEVFIDNVSMGTT